MSVKRIEPLSEKDAARFNRYYRVDENGCWVWTGPMTKAGYGRITIGGIAYRAHRVSYVTHVGEIPGDLGLDHLCHTWDASCTGGPACPHRRCINPEHLEPVTQRVNLMRGLAAAAFNATKTECMRGHAFDAENTYYPPDGTRICRKCARMSAAKYRKRLRADKAAS